VDKHDFQNSS